MKFIGICWNHPHEFVDIKFVKNYPILITADVEPCLILWDCREQARIGRVKGLKTHSAYSYEMTQYIKIQLMNIYPQLIIQTEIPVTELVEVDYQDGDEEAKKFSLRYKGSYQWKNEDIDDTSDEDQDSSKLSKILTQGFGDYVASSLLPTSSIKKPQWEEAILLYIASESGYMQMIELNTLINHLNIHTMNDLVKRGDYDPNKKVIKNTNEVFENAEAVEEYFKEREANNNAMFDMKMDKTFHLTQAPKDNERLIIDISSKLLYKLKFKTNNEAVTRAKIIRMPNQVLITCSNSYTIRLWTLFGQNLWILNLEYPLPFKWNIMINMFYQRKKKYIEAIRIKKEIDRKWYQARNTMISGSPKVQHFRKDPLEKAKGIVVFKSLVLDNKDTSTSWNTLRKIDARKSINKNKDKKSMAELHLEIMNNRTNMSEKRNEGHREDMAKNVSGNPISGKMPQYELQFDGPGEVININRIDEMVHVSGASVHRQAIKESLPHKGLHDITKEIMEASFVPQPHMANSMKTWEDEFDNDWKDTLKSLKVKNTTRELKIQNYSKRKQIFLSTEDINSMNNFSSDYSIPSLKVSTTRKKISPKNDLKVKSRFNNKSMKRELNSTSSINSKFADLNPSAMSLAQSRKSQNNINWHEYAEMRKPYLPNIFNKDFETNVKEESKSLVKSKTKHRHHKSW